MTVFHHVVVSLTHILQVLSEAEYDYVWLLVVEHCRCEIVAVEIYFTLWVLFKAIIVAVVSFWPRRLCLLG